jgi:hypothetical protein
MRHAVALRRLGQLDRAEEMLRAVREAQAAHFGPHHPDVLETTGRLCDLQLSSGAALDEPKRPQSTESPVAPEGALGGSLGDPTSVLRETAAHQAEHPGVGPEHPATLRTLVSLAEGLLRGGEAERAEAAQLLRRCKQAQRAALDATHPDLARTLALISRV